MNYVIKIIGMGYFDNYQATIDIYNSNNNLVISKKTINGECVVFLNKNQVYKINISSFRGNMIYYIFTNQSTFIFSYIYKKIFILIDQFYDLPIMKGEITLWMKKQ